MMSLRSLGAQIYVALALATAAAIVTTPSNAGAHYRALGWFVLQAFSLEAELGSVLVEEPDEPILGP